MNLEEGVEPDNALQATSRMTVTFSCESSVELRGASFYGGMYKSVFWKMDSVLVFVFWAA